MIADDVYNCGKCGLCLITCPVYREVLNETVSPRAKVQLIKHYAEKDLPLSSALNERVRTCLMCGTCTANCPSGVKHDLLFMRMRADMIQGMGDRLDRKVIHHLLCHDPLMRFAFRFMGPGRNLMPNILSKKIKIGEIPVAHLPEFNARPFRRQVPEIISPAGRPQGTILYFTGCGTNYVYEKTGHAVVSVLTGMGYRVIIPGEQVCCGLPVFFHGKPEQAKANILQNISCLSRPDITAIVTDCATCGSALTKEYPILLKAFGLDTAQAEELTCKVTDITVFLDAHADRLVPLLKKNQRPVTVTYHAPCHLRNTRRDAAKVEHLLGKIPDMTYVTSEDAATCCGGGGTFFIDHPEIAEKITAQKIKHIKATQAEQLVTGCPVCRTVLAGHLTEPEDMEVTHPIELIAERLDIPKTPPL